MYFVKTLALGFLGVCLTLVLYDDVAELIYACSDEKPHILMAEQQKMNTKPATHCAQHDSSFSLN